MLNAAIRPKTIEGMKRRAKHLKREQGVALHAALNIAAREASYQNFKHARAVLMPTGGKGGAIHRLFLTVCWRDRDTHDIGRETLEVQLNQPLDTLCSGSERKHARALRGLRLAAPDHLLDDRLAQTQGEARRTLCTAVRTLYFIEATGLRPCPPDRARLAERDLDPDLPDADHTSAWLDASGDHYILVDEPYSGRIDPRKREAWAAQQGWHLRASTWPGIHNPRHCVFFVGSRIDAAYDFAALLAKIDALERLVEEDAWPGLSVDNHEPFVSPGARGPHSRRHARARGTVMARVSATTVPASGWWSSPRRKPRGAMTLADHREAGRMIQAILFSRHRPGPVAERLEGLRSTLLDWGYCEGGSYRRSDPDLYEDYYGGIAVDDAYRVQARSPQGVIALLAGLEDRLKSHYPDCAPLRRVLGRIGTARKMARRFDQTFGAMVDRQVSLAAH